MIKHWVLVDGAPLRVEPGAGTRLMSLAKYTLVDVLETRTELYNKVPTTFHRVEYVESPQKSTIGWVYAGYLERYYGNPARSMVKNPTANLHDGMQYLVYRGKTYYNLCGFFAVAYCIGWEADVEDMLDLLSEVKPSLINLIFNSKNRGSTSADDLVNIMTMLGREAPFKLANILKDRVTGTVMMTPGRMANILSSYYVILGVSINKRSGRVARSGIRHWIVLEDINLMDYGGIVEVYNPFNERYEAYEWDQLVESAGNPNGIMVPK